MSNIYTSIDNRDEKIKHLENDLVSILEIQKELAIMIERQGSHIDYIEDMIISSKHNSEKALVELDKISNPSTPIKTYILIGATGLLMATTPIIGVLLKTASLAILYPKISLPITAILTYKML